MPLIGEIAFFTFGVVTTVIAYSAALLRPRLQGRQPCRRWFAFFVGTVAAALVFSAWTGVYGLGAAEPGLGGAGFGLFGGLAWGGFISLIHSKILWIAFDSPDRDDSGEHEQVMNTDIGVLVSDTVGRLRSFRPNPEFSGSGLLPWTIFLAAIILPMTWAYAFCQLTWMTEGAPGVEPVLPIDR
jgi:hypothetical protein